MFISVAILTGFQQEIREKVIGFGGHIQVTRFEENQSMEPRPISRNQEFLPVLESEPGIRHIQVYATKAGILKTDEQIQGIVVKGIGSDFDWSFFRSKIKEGRHFIVRDSVRTDEVILSRQLCNLLKLKLHDDIRVYFISGDHVLGRKFNICGIYETGLEEFDLMYILGDIRHIQRLNQWESDQVAGFEILIDNFNDLDRLGKFVYQAIGFSLDASTIRQLYPQIFDWLKLQDMNVLIILSLMSLVCAITMISTLLILILERTRMIGILKSLGMRTRSVRSTFLLLALYITTIGLFWGNVIGFGLCIFQKKTGFFTLPQESYYVSVVPVHLDTMNIALLNIATLALCYLMMLIPSMIVSKISPVNAIRFR